MRGFKKDLTGKIINGLEIIKLSDRKDKNLNRFWWVKCHCGKTFETRTQSFSRSNAIQSCGCLKTTKSTKNKTSEPIFVGEMINGCEVIELVKDKRHTDGSRLWSIKCSCGNLFETKSYYLRNGLVKSCGCKHFGDQGPSCDIIGNIYNNIKIIKLIGKRKHDYIYLAECFCGEQFECRAADIKSGHTKSCGCLNKIKYKNFKLCSRWELYIAIFLDFKNIEWEYDVKLTINTNGQYIDYYSDFYLPNENKYLEVKGDIYIHNITKIETLTQGEYNIQILKKNEIETMIGISINRLNYAYGRGGIEAVENLISESLKGE